MDIFISYSSADLSVVYAFKKLLDNVSSKSLSIFIADKIKDSTGISFGEEFSSTIKDKINQAKYLIVVLTNQSIHSKWVFYEAGMAEAFGKSIFCLIMDESLNGKIKDTPFHTKHNCHMNHDNLKNMLHELIGNSDKTSTFVDNEISEFIKVNTGLKNILQSRILSAIHEYSDQKKQRFVNTNAYRFNDINEGWRLVFGVFNEESFKNGYSSIIRDYTISSHRISSFQEKESFGDYLDILIGYFHSRYYNTNHANMKLLVMLESSKYGNDHGEQYYKNIIEIFYGVDDIDSAYDLLSVLGTPCKNINFEIRLINKSILHKIIDNSHNGVILKDPFNIYNQDILSHIGVEKVRKNGALQPRFHLNIDERIVENHTKVFDLLWDECFKYQKVFLSRCNRKYYSNFGSGQLFNKLANISFT